MGRKKNPTFEDAMQALGLPYEATSPGHLLNASSDSVMVVATTRVTDNPRYFFGFYDRVEAYRVAQNLKSKRAVAHVQLFPGAESI